jgi:hypothetical protein
MHLLLELFIAYINVRRVAYMVYLVNVRSGGLFAYMRGRGSVGITDMPPAECVARP